MLARIALSLLNFYQGYIRALAPCACRFTPTCSEYAKQAVVKYGFYKGALLAAKRLLLCHPFSQKSSDDPLL
jgi:hypothetical protein